jgi:hypothetical protein
MAIQTYENFVLEHKMTDLVNTNVNVNALYTIDNSLALEAGLKKVINKYTYTGAVEKLAKGAKNTTRGAVAYIPSEYTVERYQQTFGYNDMDIMTDPYILDVMTTGAAQVMANEIREEYFTELAKISNTDTYETFGYDAVVDALAKIGHEVEDGMFIVMGLDAKAEVRKDADYKASRQGEILYTGQFGDICGVPCVASKLVPAGTVYITTKDAVKFFVKKDGSVEQDRDIETKDNTVVYERHGLMALVDESKSIKLTKNA